MPRCGAPFDENKRPPLDKGDFRGVLETESTHPGAARHPSHGGDSQETHYHSSFSPNWISRAARALEIWPKNALCTPRSGCPN